MSSSGYLERLKTDFPDFTKYISLLDSQRAFVLRQVLGGKTPMEVGQALNISQRQARQIEEKACRQLRRILTRFSQDEKRLLSVAEVSDLLGVHMNTVRRWSERGLLTAYYIGSRGDRRFRRQDIDSFLRKAVKHD